MVWKKGMKKKKWDRVSHTPVSNMNYLTPNSILKAHIMRIKEEAKVLTGRSFGTHAERGTAAYERMLKETLDCAIQMAKDDEVLSEKEKEIVILRLNHDYDYGFKMREVERKDKDHI